MIDVVVSSAMLNHATAPSRLFKKTVQQGRSERLKMVLLSLLVDVVLGWPG
jgi:hypothetical protein